MQTAANITTFTTRYSWCKTPTTTATPPSSTRLLMSLLSGSMKSTRWLPRPSL